MTEHTKRNIVIFTDNDSDGASSGYIVADKYASDKDVNVEIVPLKRSPEPIRAIIQESINTNDCEVYFFDTTPNKEELDFLLSPKNFEGDDKKQQVKSVTIWDHHFTEKARLDSYEPPKYDDFIIPAYECDIDVDCRSCAELVWKKTHPAKALPDYVELISRMESSKNRPLSKDDSSAAAFLESKDFLTPETIIASFNTLSKMSMEEMANEGRSILADQLKNAKKLFENIVYTHIELLEGFKMWVPMANTPIDVYGRSIDLALVEKAKEGTGCGVFLLWSQTANGQVHVSIRTDGSPNAGEIAEHLKKTIAVSGGGRDKAAAVQFESLIDFVNKVPIYTDMEMRQKMWEPENNGKHKLVLWEDNCFLPDESLENESSEDICRAGFKESFNVMAGRFVPQITITHNCVETTNAIIQEDDTLKPVLFNMCADDLGSDNSEDIRIKALNKYNMSYGVSIKPEDCLVITCNNEQVTNAKKLGMSVLQWRFNKEASISPDADYIAYDSGSILKMIDLLI